METLTILIAQTKGAAIIEIILLLLVAVVVGYITAWRYFRSVYLKRIEVIESGIDELKKQIVDLEAEKSNLGKRLSELEAEKNHD